MEKKNIFDFSLEKLTTEFVNLGQTKFRSKQLFSWIYKKNVYDFSLMTDVSLSFREYLNENYYFYWPSIYKKQISSDGTIKLLLEMKDGAKVETVLMKYNYGNVICVSSQVGCNMGCAFCASGLLKKERNLSTGEMLAQLLTVNSLLENEKVTHVVVMGTGEPFDNYENVLDFIRICNHVCGLEIGARHITVSTCGLVDGIRAYGKEGLQINLAISLHAPNDEIRNKLMPISRKYPMNELMKAIKEYEENANRRVTFEYILLKGLNDSDECAYELIRLIKKYDIFAYVNLIPYNEVKEKRFKRSSNERIKEFSTILNKNGVNTTIRKEFGSDIDAACGQLRAKVVLGEK